MHYDTIDIQTVNIHITLICNSANGDANFAIFIILCNAEYAVMAQ